MSNVIFLIIGFIIGGCFGIGFLALFQAHRVNEYVAEINTLKEKLNNK